MGVSKPTTCIQRNIVKTRDATALILLAALALTGCKPDAALKKGEIIDKGIKPIGSGARDPGFPIDATQFGSIKGIVHFNGKPPARVPIDMSMDPACSMTGGENLSEQFAVTNGKLANVFVYIKHGATPSQAAGSPPVILDQKGCRYTPHVIAIQQGGYVEFHNSDPTMHNIHTLPAAVGNQAVDVSQGPMGQPQVRQFNSPELMMPIRCNNHPWMNAFLNVADTPYFAVSAPDGSFTLAGLPPGNYVLAAVHEKLGEQDIQITVPVKSTAKADITFGPK
jgi:hypothetical protein